MNTYCGWIKIYRSITDWDWYKDSKTKSLFLHLLIMANHKDGNFQGIAIKRGQFLTGRKVLANDLGLSEQEIRTSLSRLQKSGNINQQSTNKNTLITVMKYDDFQIGNQQSTNETSNDQPASNQQPTSNQPTDNHKQECNNKRMEECKEEKNSLNTVVPSEPTKKQKKKPDYSQAFDDLWVDMLQSNRSGDSKKTASQRYEACRKAGLCHENILLGCKYWAEVNETRDASYRKGLSAWLYVENVQDVMNGNVVVPKKSSKDMSFEERILETVSKFDYSEFEDNSDEYDIQQQIKEIEA